LQDATGRSIGCVIIFRDVTLLLQLEEGARQSQKLEAVGRLAGGIAHDFNNLLAIINSFADLLLLKVKAGDPLEKFYRNIRAAGQRGADLVSQLMTFSRRAPATPRLVQLADIVAEAHKMLRPLIRENIELALEVAPNLPLLHMDPGQVEQILVNLCLNSRDAIAENGRIVIQASVRVFSAAEALARDLPGSGEYVQLAVADNGSGIAPDIRGKIFEPFFTTKEVGKGTGLGLAMVYSLVQQSHGHIEVESEPGRGATFSIFLPAATRMAVVAEGPATALMTTPRGHERVLLVEDDGNFADCVKNILEIHGYTVTVARDGAEALEQYRAHQGQIDLLLADQVLPKIPGRRVADELRRQQPDLRVLFMSGYDATDEEMKSNNSHTTRMQKPFSLQALLLRIRSLLDAPAEPLLAQTHPAG
jgi:nitrogen-specific signal transduction histidine kinase